MPKRVTLILIAILFLSTGIAFAAWQGTAWVSDGEVISASSLKNNLDYLYERTNPSTNFVYPPTCTGANNVLQWDGSNWLCASI